MRPSQRRSIGYSSSGRRWTRGDRGEPVDSAIRRNYPDGALQNPIFWMGGDSASTPNWSAYGSAQVPGSWGMQDWVSNDGILPAITRATNLIVGPICRTDWRYWRKITEIMPQDIRASDEELPEPLWISDPQLVNRIPGGEAGRPTIPRPRRLGASNFWRTLVCQSLWWGVSAVLWVEDFQQRPLAGTLRIVNPDRWNFSDDGSRFVLLGDGTEEPLESDMDGGFDVGGVRWMMRLLHNFAPNDGGSASGALSRSGLVISTGNKMNSYLNGILGSGVPTGLLRVATPNYTQPQAEALKAQWMAAHGGSKRSIGVLASGIDFQPLQLSVVDSDVVQAKGAHLVDIAHMFGISAGMLDASTGSSNNITYASISDRRRDHLDHSLADLGRSVEDLITSMLPWGQNMSIDWLNYVQTDPSQSLPFVESGLEHNYMTVSEVRKRLRITPTENPELPGQTAQLDAGGEQADEPADDE